VEAQNEGWLYSSQSFAFTEDTCNFQDKASASGSLNQLMSEKFEDRNVADFNTYSPEIDHDQMWMVEDARFMLQNDIDFVI
jgi:hypothetical protein